MRSVTTIGYKVFSDDLSVIPIRDGDACRVINTISPNSYGVATRDEEFRNALRASDFLVLDGVYFAFAALLLEGKGIKPNQGPDVFDHFVKRLDACHGRAFFLGSTTTTLERIRERMAREYPNITVGAYSPPFKPQFSDEDNAEMVAAINAFEPDMLFVGMTCPKQEKWAIANRNRIKPCLAACIGNVFDWYAGTQKCIPKIWFRLRLAWLARIYYRPEIFRRNIGNQMKFFRDILLIFLKLKKYD